MNVSLRDFSETIAVAGPSNIRAEFSVTNILPSSDLIRLSSFGVDAAAVIILLTPLTIPMHIMTTAVRWRLRIRSHPIGRKGSRGRSARFDILLSVGIRQCVILGMGVVVAHETPTLRSSWRYVLLQWMMAMSNTLRRDRKPATGRIQSIAGAGTSIAGYML